MKLFKKISNIIFGREKKLQPGRINISRTKHITFLFYSFFIILAVRAVIIQVFPSSKDSLLSIAERQYQQTVQLASYRGNIFDRKGVPFAISLKKPSIAINPRVFDPSPDEIKKLSKLTEVSQSHIKELAKKASYFAWLKRKLPNEKAEAISKLNINGLWEIMEPARYYPAGNAASNLIGYVGIDNSGLLGLEQKYNSTLKGVAAKVIGSQDARGNKIYFNSNKASPEESGNNIHLTIDAAIQEIAQESLNKWVKEADAKGGFVIVNDPHTGKVLAMANAPTFDPNDRSFDIKKSSNQAISNLFEPGSTMKPFVIASALEKGKVKSDEILDCEKSGRYKVGPKSWISDDHPKEKLSVEDVLVHSSNICAYKVAERIGAQALYDTFKGFGFATEKPILGLLGENKGRLSDWKDWRPIRFANIAFGQGHIVTGLEMSRAYSVLANGGSLVNLTVVEKITSESGKVISASQTEHLGQIISPETALEIRKTLGRVVTEGTARLASTELFTTGGKTGTAEKVDSETKAYSKTKRVASFAGFAPVLDPHIVIYVVIDEPNKKPYYGGKWAAPVFSEIAEKTLKYLNVAPDKPSLTVGHNEHHPEKHEKEKAL